MDSLRIWDSHTFIQACHFKKYLKSLLFSPHSKGEGKLVMADTIRLPFSIKGMPAMIINIKPNIWNQKEIKKGVAS